MLPLPLSASNQFCRCSVLQRQRQTSLYDNTGMKTSGYRPFLNQNDSHITQPKRRMKSPYIQNVRKDSSRQKKATEFVQPQGSSSPLAQLHEILATNSRIHQKHGPPTWLLPIKLQDNLMSGWIGKAQCLFQSWKRLSVSFRGRPVTQGPRQVGHHGPLRTSFEHRLPPQFTRGRAHSKGVSGGSFNV